MKEEDRFEAHRSFYEKCCELLGLPQIFVPKHYRLTRWNNRHPGNGRMDGYGQIRMYSPTLIHICFRHPTPVNKTFTSTDAVFDFLRGLSSSGP